MNTNWKNEVEKLNSKTYVLPDGWTSREAVAAALECSEERVDDALRAGLKSGRFIKQSHKVWSAALGRCAQVIAYHDTTLDAKAAAPDLDALKKLRAAGKSYTEIAAMTGIGRESVRSKLRRAK